PYYTVQHQSSMRRNINMPSVSEPAAGVQKCYSSEFSHQEAHLASANVTPQKASMSGVSHEVVIQHASAPPRQRVSSP
ncbi:hypothetical protein S245_063768, partial [Arachis hypogaea]